MPQIDVSEQQILDALDRLSPRGRREAVRRLIAGASVLDRTMDSLQPRIAELARPEVWTGRSSPMRNASVSCTSPPRMITPSPHHRVWGPNGAPPCAVRWRRLIDVLIDVGQAAQVPVSSRAQLDPSRVSMRLWVRGR